MILDLWGVPHHAMVVVFPERNFSIDSGSAYCDNVANASKKINKNSSNHHALLCQFDFFSDLIINAIFEVSLWRISILL